MYDQDIQQHGKTSYLSIWSVWIGSMSIEEKCERDIMRIDKYMF